mmetsp:Transcript_9698/g.12747  ORF Transcript_9698/g.12747 Transcript_9698/m.12747 type:complete len:401 (-) Transcript_9698:16-1218(-)
MYVPRKQHSTCFFFIFSLVLGVGLTSAFIVLPAPESRLPNFKSRDAGSLSLGYEVRHVKSVLLSTTDENDEAKKLLDQVNKLRAEIAGLEGKTIDEVEAEAKAVTTSGDADKEIIAEAAKYRRESDNIPVSSTTDGRFLQLPVTADDQVEQAARAVERAFKDGKTRQTVRLALLKNDGSLGDSPEEWSGGAQQMYREAGCPLTVALLREIRAPTGDAVSSPKVNYPPEIKTQDIWDFDGSGLVTAEAAAGPKGDVQALVFPNTDTKYLKDVKEISKAMGDRLFLIVNPFWRNVDSWGFNILAPNAKKLAQETIFDQGYEETYALNRFSVRGEECAALKVYPYDWQLFAYGEEEYWPYNEKVVRLGSSEKEPRSSQFTELLNQLPEFKLSKNMRQLQRKMK